MSAYTEVKTQFKDAKMLCEALKALGITEVLHHGKAVQLTGYHGDKRADTAEIVIPRRVISDASNDIGFKLQADGSYKAIISDYDRSIGYNLNWLNKLSDSYSERKTMAIATKQGLRFLSRKVENGKIKLQFAKL